MKYNRLCIIHIAGFQTWIGKFDVKSSSVYFYVQRSTHFKTEGVPITFEVTRLNVGNAMNAGSGIFTAPRAGIYFFSFSGIGSIDTVFVPRLYLNGNVIGSGSADMAGSGVVEPTFTLQSTLQLKAGDQVSLKSGGSGYLYDNDNHFTHFTGWLLQEDLNY